MSLVKLEWRKSAFNGELHSSDGTSTKNAYDIRVWKKQITTDRQSIVYRVYVNSNHNNDFKNLKDAKLWCLILENREMIEK